MTGKYLTVWVTGMVLASTVILGLFGKIDLAAFVLFTGLIPIIITAFAWD